MRDGRGEERTRDREVCADRGSLASHGAKSAKDEEGAEEVEEEEPPPPISSTGHGRGP